MVLSGDTFLLFWMIPALAGEAFALFMLFRMIKSRSSDRNRR